MKRSFLASKEPECPSLRRGNGWPPHSVPAGRAARGKLRPGRFVPVLVYPEPRPVSTGPRGPVEARGQREKDVENTMQFPFSSQMPFSPPHFALIS